ncbi:MAG: hypothetical protein AAB363_00780 [Planctomycetota bacterium]
MTETELALAATLLDEIRAKLDELAGGDLELVWALRRKLYKELVYDERGKPMYRRALKLKKRESQQGKCAVCDADLPEIGAVLDRLLAMKGYTIENTRLLCPTCDTRIQTERNYA